MISLESCSTMQASATLTKRAAMYGAARSWIKTGLLPNDPDSAQRDACYSVHL